MKRTYKILITALVILIAAGIIVYKNSHTVSSEKAANYKELTAPSKLPRMIEIGSTTCVPCQMMEEVLEKLRNNYCDKIEVHFVDVEKDGQTPADFKIKMIPTQVFLDTQGKEFFRHEGYYPLPEIVAMLKGHGVNLSSSADASKSSSVFAFLTSALGKGWLLPLAAAFIWGILSVILSPCHLASIPLIVGYIDQQGQISTRRAAWIATLFSSGILITIAIIGIITALAGSQLGELGSWSNYLVAAIFFLVGLYLLEIVSNPFNAPGQIKMQRRGALAALILGLVFGLALGPCTFAYMAPVLAIAFKTGSDNLIFGCILLLIYGIGHCSVIILAGTFTEAVQHYLNWNENSKATIIIKKICAVLIIISGYYLLLK